MRMHLIGGLAAATLMMSFSTDADARPFRPGLLPNGGENSCANCHVSPAGGGTRTLFGEDVRANVSVGGMEFFWADVCALDSDGDGQTNGEELGDPCCLWDDTSDDLLRLGDISFPGDDTSTSADPAGPDDDADGISNACDPDYVPPEDMGMGGDDMGMGGMDMGGEADMGGNNTANNTPNNTANNTPGNNDPGNNGSPDMGTGSGDDMGGSMADDEDGGCGCSSAPTSTATPWLLALAFVFGRVRRRR